MVVILLGPPGVGKGTQGSMLAEALEWDRLATGDLLREARRRGTELGRQAATYMDAGELVPDSLIVAMVRERLEYEGEFYQIPFRGPGATGLGKPLKTILHPVRDAIPIYLAAIGPKNVALTSEIADGWLPILYSPEREDVFADDLEQGRKAGDRDHDPSIRATIAVEVGDDLDACRDRIRPGLALYIGGMGARGKNFYNRLAVRYGFEAEAARIQDLYLEGHKDEAAAAVPDALVDEVALVGPMGRIRDRLEAWRESRVDTLLLKTLDTTVIESLAESA